VNDPNAGAIAAGMPLSFQPPYGWPMPTTDWIIEHQGWAQPRGWVPTPGCPPAPENWTFWLKNTNW